MSDETRLDAPNQQVVRPDGSGPGDEGSGGSTREAEPERRGPGRPKGSKNRSKDEDTHDDDDEAAA